ncbi:MAG: PAS domain S-box protein [Planctomycetota bacterium]
MEAFSLKCRVAVAEISNNSQPPSLVVGIGASAGGLEPLEQFFSAVPLDTGMAFVVIQHLSPDYPSLMSELLARHTRLPIRRVEDNMAVHGDAVYLIPPRKNMVVEDGMLRLSEQSRVEEHPPLPIDIFFKSLASDLGEKAVAIVLSGTGTDGSRGVKAIKDGGGLVLVQDEFTAKFNGMPRAAIDSGTVDAAFTPAEMPGYLVAYRDDPSAKPLPEDEETDLEGIDAVLSLLNRQYEIDFSLYKPATVHRRIERRILLGPEPTIDAYVDRLRDDPTELNRLYKDLLIGVTQFFRDAAAYDSLQKHVIPNIFQAHGSDEEIRIWIAGCATGEEAYSMAILFDEARRKLGREHQPVRIFATDAHRTSIEFAAAGRYDAESLREVMPDRLSTYFAPVGSKFQVVPKLRQMITFAPQNMISDAPFTRMDLVTCRNVLIYFRQPVQTQVISLLHFALNTGGFLFLGPSETTQPFRDEFEAMDPHWRIYRKRRDVRLLSPTRLPTRTPTLSVPSRSSIPAGSPAALGPDLRLLRVYDLLLQDAIDASVLINERREVVHVFGNARNLLKLPIGRRAYDVVSMLDEPLKPAVSAAIQKCWQQREEVSVGVARLDDRTVIQISARPITTVVDAEMYTLIKLQREDRPAPEPSHSEEQASEFTFDSEGANQKRVLDLEQELQYTKENLQTTIEELETSNEELNATNEELIASNEELQSTNEELHSVNEELHTVNAEYQQKITELTQLTDDMNNLLASSEIGTLFVDRSLRIRRFTPAMEGLMKVRDADIGRRFDEISPKFQHESLLEDARQAIETGETRQVEVPSKDAEHSYLLRINPYRLANGNIDGLVLTFVDITQLRLAERRLAESEERFKLAANNTPLMIWLTDEGGQLAWISDSWLAFVGKPLESQIGYGWGSVAHPDDVEQLNEAWRTTVTDRARWDHEFRVLSKDGTPRWFYGTGQPRFGDDGQFLGHIGTITDITDLRRTQQELLSVTQRFEAFMSNSPAMKWAVDEDGRFVFMNATYERLMGVKAEDSIGKQPVDTLAQKTIETMLHRSEETGDQPQELTFEIEVTAGEVTREFLVTNFVFHEPGGRKLIGGSALDITSLKQTQRELAESSERLGLALRSSNSGLWDLNVRTGEMYFSDMYYGMIGYGPGELPASFETWEELVHPDDLREAKERIERCVSGEADSYRSTFRMLCKDEAYRWVVSIGETTDHGPDGKPARITGLHLDVDDLKTTQLALEELNAELEDRVRQRTAELIESEQRFQAVADNAPIILWVNDQADAMVWGNRGWLEFTGQEEARISCERWLEVVHEDDLGAMREAWEKAIKTSKSWGYEFRARRHDGEYRWMFMHGMPQYREDGGCIGYVGTIVDVTDRREAQEQLKQAHGELERRVAERTSELQVNVESLAARNRELDQFAHAASHDLRSPLRTILGFAEHLREAETLSDGEEGVAAIDRITAAAERMSRLIDSLLLFATVGRGELRLETIDPAAVLNQVLSDLAQEIEAAGAQVIVSEPLPMIVGDPSMIRSVFQNLISNAVKYRRDEPPRVEVSGAQEDDSYRFSVSDNGSGLRAEDVERAFEPFQRLHPGKQNRGTGIGLSICRRVVERHGGSISARSEPNRGTVFTFTIPHREAQKDKSWPPTTPIRPS